VRILCTHVLLFSRTATLNQVGSTKALPKIHSEPNNLRFLSIDLGAGVRTLRQPSSSMTIFERDALTTLLLTTAPSARRMGKSVLRGGCEESGLPTSQIDVPVSSVQKVVCAAHPNVATPETTRDMTGSGSANLMFDNNRPHCIRPCY
jgi:hypothetical protein